MILALGDGDEPLVVDVGLESILNNGDVFLSETGKLQSDRLENHGLLNVESRSRAVSRQIENQAGALINIHGEDSTVESTGKQLDNFGTIKFACRLSGAFQSNDSDNGSRTCVGFGSCWFDDLGYFLEAKKRPRRYRSLKYAAHEISQTI